MTNKIFKGIRLSIIAAIILGLLVLAIPSGSGFAQTPQPRTTDPRGNENWELGRRPLEWAYKLAQRRLREQALLFRRMDQGIKRAEALIKRLKANDKGTQALEAALKVFEAKKADAYKFHEEASAILEKHEGFDKNGRVMDPALARQTVKTANEKMTEARKIAGPAYREFFKVLREWLAANKPPNTN